MAYRDLRDWLEQVELFGELRRIEGADWDLEIGAIADMARKESKTAPCILFDSIKGYPKGYRLAVGLDDPLRSRPGYRDFAALLERSAGPNYPKGKKGI